MNPLSPRAVLTWAVAALAVDLATTNPAYRLLLIGVLVDVLLALVPTDRTLRPVVTAVGMVGAFAVALQVLLGRTGAHVLVAIPAEVPLIGGPITAESLAYGIGAALGIVGAIVAIAPLSVVLETHELVDALPRRLERSALVVASALNLVPAVGRTAIAIHDAEIMRGWRPRGPRAWADILVPTMLGALDDSIGLAEVMESRAFGSGRRTRYRPSTWTRRDTVVVVAAVGAATAFVVGRIAGWPLDWTPYPSLSLPTVDPLPIAAIILLAAPLAARSRPDRDLVGTWS